MQPTTFTLKQAAILAIIIMVGVAAGMLLANKVA